MAKCGAEICSGSLFVVRKSFAAGASTSRPSDVCTSHRRSASCAASMYSSTVHRAPRARSMALAGCSTPFMVAQGNPCLLKARARCSRCGARAIFLSLTVFTTFLGFVLPRDDLEALVHPEKHVKRTSRRAAPYPPRHGTSLPDALGPASMAAVATTTPAASVVGTTDHGPANKRLRDEQNGSDPSDGNTDDMDQASFTVVSYKKKRGTGVPVVFRPTIDGGSLWKVNPNIVASAVVTSAQEKVLNHRLNKDGSLMVTVSTLPAANRLLTVTELAGVAVEARVPYSYTANYGKIQDVPLSYSNEELQDYLRDQGVVSARRLTTFTPEDGGKVKEVRRRSVILEFDRDSPLPKRVTLGFCSYPVAEYIGAATQCYKCQRHGHISRHCTGPVRCKVCAGPHSHKECTSRAQPKCANCGGPHPASYGGCIKKKAATLARTLEQAQGKPPRRNEPPPNPEVVFTSMTDVSQEQSPQSQKTSGNTYADVTKKKRGKSMGLSHSSKPPQPVSQDPPSDYGRQQSQSLQQDKVNCERQQLGNTDQDVTRILIPMLFAAIKALVRGNPSSRSLPEVEAILTMEPLVSTFYAPQGRAPSQY
ncbi:hypothetical protein HPB52_004891 [Rhipicephalus sanguineus]|uniref:CCHC-type domain-containing protein n=1 Tax=Rhipicephalus sanguineus TaxID=34632 RepID=A0A9D4SQQ3_RHISA|nr:hypothetical protein HPB52_004891 [Rhipicephalus sanguineus]